MTNPKKLMTEIMAMLEYENKALSRGIEEASEYPSLWINLQQRVIKIDGKEFLIEVSEIK